MDKKRPIHLIAHRINNPKYIEVASNSGVSAIECDVQFNSKLDKFQIGHAFAPKYDFDVWLREICRVTTVSDNKISLIIFDCKFARGDNQSAKIFQKLIEKVRIATSDNNFSINTIFSIANYADRKSFDLIKDDFRVNEGVAIDACKDSDLVEKFFKDNNINNCWFGYGVFAFAPVKILKYIKNAVFIKNKNKVIKNVYVWTLFSSKKALLYIEKVGADSVMINIRNTGTFPNCSIIGLGKSLDSHNEVRLATVNDNIFQNK